MPTRYLWFNEAMAGQWPVYFTGEFKEIDNEEPMPVYTPNVHEAKAYASIEDACYDKYVFGLTEVQPEEHAFSY